MRVEFHLMVYTAPAHLNGMRNWEVITSWSCFRIGGHPLMIPESERKALRDMWQSRVLPKLP